jgi:hypothetical protein
MSGDVFIFINKLREKINFLFGTVMVFPSGTWNWRKLLWEGWHQVKIHGGIGLV